MTSTTTAAARTVEKFALGWAVLVAAFALPPLVLVEGLRARS
jgi:hypothetical protein